MDQSFVVTYDGYDEHQHVDTAGVLSLLREPDASDIDISLVLPRQPDVGGLVLSQIQVRCLESYLPRTGSVLLDVKNSWMWSIVAMGDHGRALSSSFAALSLARVGMVLNNEGLIMQGRDQYGLALTSLQKALYDPVLAFQDRTLAAIRTLSIYELFAPTFAPVPPGRVHEKGMAQWCVAAGPLSINTEFAMQVFHDVRWCIMNHAIRGRQSSELGNKDWRTLPWQHFTKDCYQQLLDIGFELAALLEQVDASVGTNKSMTFPSKIEQLSLACLRVSKKLEKWYSDFWACDEHPQEDYDEDDMVDVQSCPLHHPSNPPEFSGLWEATNITYYWWFKLILSDIMSSVFPLASQQEQIALNSDRLATDIVFAVPYFLADDTGWLGPQRLFFPLQRAMEHLAKVDSPFYSDAQKRFGTMIARLRVS